MSRVTVKSVKSFRGMEGLGFNAKLFLDGKEVAFVIDQGNGGCCIYQWKDKAAEAELKAIAAACPPEPCTFCDACKAGRPCEEPLAKDVDWVVSDAVSDFEEEKKLRSWCKTKTVFRNPDSQKGAWYTVNCPFNPGIRAIVLAKHPQAQFANEMQWS